MQLVTSPNRWSCLPCSLAMVLDVPLKTILFLAGHDGSEILWPDAPEPLKRKAFHIEEMQYIARKFSKALVPYVPEFAYRPEGFRGEPLYYSFSLMEVITERDGIILGNYVDSTNRHAVAWDAKGRTIYDSSGRLSQLSEFRVETFYAAIGL